MRNSKSFTLSSPQIDLLSLRLGFMTMTFQGMIWFRIDNFNAVTLNDLALHHRETKGIAKG
ncbi:unnamed protein product [Brassica oleracea var. botrytis]